jgi:hypothetical protein
MSYMINKGNRIGQYYLFANSARVLLYLALLFDFVLFLVVDLLLLLLVAILLFAFDFDLGLVAFLVVSLASLLVVVIGPGGDSFDILI